MISTSTDKAALEQHFRKDPVLYAYHIGDLDDFFFPKCQWLVYQTDDGVIDEALLIYKGPSTPTVLAFGVSNEFNSLVEASIADLPGRFFCHFQKAQRKLLAQAFEIQAFGPHLKMQLKDYTPPPNDPRSDAVDRFDRSHLSMLQSFYAEAYPDSYFDQRMLDTGKCFGYFENNQLLAAAGLHVYSVEYDIAVLGNIATMPADRGRGLGTLMTAHLVSELVAERRGCVCLNVKADNMAAIKCYEKLGFAIVHQYEEGLFVRQ
ncbi:MAG: GNAT family N-acetyltransferase [candidate division Zixibacteria bacterium]|nr:GNAT family N-acetyltransferase [candidate division Zixibacteria bacterium]MDH3938228.1 GNAT family N-acetyltransferase [candidate division Zixibacteria bacterium]MDH4032908.1 GNAT family N-acetyltransferase [candidate division Zixibacteria bacterium]